MVLINVRKASVRMRSKCCRFGILCAICVLPIVQSCREKREKNFLLFPEKEQFVSKTTDTIPLGENLILMGNINQCLSLSDTSFLVTDGQHVVVYGMDGRQLAVVSERGHARNEYVNVGAMYASSRYIYLWCNMTLKLLQFTPDGEFVGKYDGPDKAISKFVVQDDSLVYYCVTGRDDYSLNVYDLKNGKLLEEAGELDNEDIMLFFNNHSGALALWHDEVLFMPPSRMDLMSMRGAQYSGVVGTVADKDFSCAEVKTNPRDEVDIDIREVYDYLLKNSMVAGMYADDTLLCIMTETGEFHPQKDTLQTAGRNLNLFFLGKGYKPLRAVRAGYPVGTSCYYYYHSCLYVLLNRPDTGKYEILKYQVG